MPIEYVLYSTYDALGEALLKGHVDVAWNSPLGHAKFHLKAGGSTAVVMRDVDVNYKIKLIVRKDAGVSTVKDLAGKTMIFGSCDSADATVLPVYYLKKDGVNFEKVKIVSLHNEVDEMGCPCHSQHHVLAALLKGRGQAGIISSRLWQKLQTEKPTEAAQFKEIWTSPGFSHCVFTARKDFDKETCERFAKLMIAMDGKDAVTCEILKLEHCKKWVPAGPKAQEGFATLLTALREQPSVASLLLK
jgi:phosphate/phosphite/phosphonate ABC transporter binding protein